MAKKTTKNIKDMDVKDLKPFAIPVLSGFSLIILAFVSFNILSNKISTKKSEFEKQKKEEVVLLEKQRILSEFDSVVPKDIFSTVDLALPDDNPALMMLSQIKFLTSSLGLSIVELNVGKVSDLEKEVHMVSINLNVDGSLDQVISFIKTLKTLAPVNTIDNVEFINNVGKTRGEVSLLVYYSEHPKKIPPITEAIKELSSSEQSLLYELSSLTPPEFGLIVPRQPVERPDPFQ